MHQPSRIKLPAKLENLEQFMGFLSGCAREHGMEQKRVVEIEIAAEEALVNVFNYAYQDRDGDVEMICKSDTYDKFVIEIIDSGVYFDLLSLKKPDISLDISERKIGGLGIFLMKNLIDDVQYRREEDKNIVTLVVSKTQID